MQEHICGCQLNLHVIYLITAGIKPLLAALKVIWFCRMEVEHFVPDRAGFGEVRIGTFFLSSIPFTRITQRASTFFSFLTSRTRKRSPIGPEEVRYRPEIFLTLTRTMLAVDSSRSIDRVRCRFLRDRAVFTAYGPSRELHVLHRLWFLQLP